MNDNIKNFFNNIDNTILNDPINLAKEFLLYTATNSDTKNLDIENNSISILCDDKSLDFITKRSLLISGNLLLTNNYATPIEIYTDKSHIDDGYVYSYYTYNNDLLALGLWLKNVKSLLIHGNIIYIPNAYKSLSDWHPFGYKIYGSHRTTLTNLNAFSKSIVQSKKLISTSQNANSSFLKPILNIEIPVIDNIDMESYSNITLENLEYLQNFQVYLKSTILNFNDLSQKNITKISLEIQSQLNDIKRTYNKTINKYKISSAIGCISTITAILFAIHPNISEVIKIASGIGSGGGLVPFLQSNIEYFTLNDTLKDNNCYYLWILQHNSNF